MQNLCIGLFTATLCHCRNKHPYFLYSLTVHKPPNCSRKPRFSTVSPALSREVLFFLAVSTSSRPPSSICHIMRFIATGLSMNKKPKELLLILQNPLLKCLSYLYRLLKHTSLFPPLMGPLASLN